MTVPTTPNGKALSPCGVAWRRVSIEGDQPVSPPPGFPTIGSVVRLCRSTSSPAEMLKVFNVMGLSEPIVFTDLGTPDTCLGDYMNLAYNTWLHDRGFKPSERRLRQLGNDFLLGLRIA